MWEPTFLGAGNCEMFGRVIAFWKNSLIIVISTISFFFLYSTEFREIQLITFTHSIWFRAEPICFDSSKYIVTLKFLLLFSRKDVRTDGCDWRHQLSPGHARLQHLVPPDQGVLQRNHVRGRRLRTSHSNDRPQIPAGSKTEFAQGQRSRDQNWHWP